MSKPIALCGGYYQDESDTYPVAQCKDCLRHTLPVCWRNDWIIAPDFLDKCPEKLPKKETK